MTLQVTVAQAASSVRRALDDDLWLRFSKLCQMQRYELNKLVDAQASFNPITYIRVAAALETVGVTTRLSEVDRATKIVMMNLGLTNCGEFKDIFEKTHDRIDVPKFVCEGTRISEQTRERINLLAKRISKGKQISSKGSIDLSDVEIIRHKLSTNASASPTPLPVPKFQESAPNPITIASATRSAKIADSLVSVFNSIGNIASVGIDAGELPDEAKLHIVFTTAQLFKKLGIDRTTLERIRRHQEQHSGNVSELATILFQGVKR